MEVGDYDFGPNHRSLTWVATRHFLDLGPLAEGVVVVVFGLALVWIAWLERASRWEGFLWTTGLILIVTNLVAPRTATTHYTLLLLPLCAWFARLKHRLGRFTAVLAVIGIQVVLLVGTWAIFLTTFQGRYEAALVYLPFPVLMLIVQGLTGERWINGR